MYSKSFIITIVITVFLWSFVCCEKSKIPTGKADDSDEEKMMLEIFIIVLLPPNLPGLPMESLLPTCICRRIILNFRTDIIKSGC